MSPEQPPSMESPKPTVPAELAEVVRAGVKAARLVPGAVALGGTVCALYAGHRLSYDIDFVVSDLIDRFDQIREKLEAQSEWSLERVKPPVVILGSIDRIPIGYRQLRRPEPLDAIEVETAEGSLPIPTLREMLRVKAFLASDRNYVRDYCDFAELTLLLPHGEVVDSLIQLDEKWGTAQRPGIALEVMKALAECRPRDDGETVFRQMRFLRPKIATWEGVRVICRDVAKELSARLLGE